MKGRPRRPPRHGPGDRRPHQCRRHHGRRRCGLRGRRPTRPRAWMRCSMSAPKTQEEIDALCGAVRIPVILGGVPGEAARPADACGSRRARVPRGPPAFPGVDPGALRDDEKPCAMGRQPRSSRASRPPSLPIAPPAPPTTRLRSRSFWSRSQVRLPVVSWTCVPGRRAARRGEPGSFPPQMCRGPGSRCARAGKAKREDARRSGSGRWVCTARLAVGWVERSETQRARKQCWVSPSAQPNLHKRIA